jgi:hypothetical protein
MPLTYRPVRRQSALRHVAPSREAAIEAGALHYRDDSAVPCSHCGGSIRRLANGNCVCRPVRTIHRAGR